MNTEKKQGKMLKPRYLRGSIYIADLGRDGKSGEQIGVRPVLILQNDVSNKKKPSLVVATITSDIPDKVCRYYIKLTAEKYERIKVDSIIQLDQIKTISKDRIRVPLPLVSLDKDDIKRVDEALLYSLGISI